MIWRLLEGDRFGGYSINGTVLKDGMPFWLRARDGTVLRATVRHARDDGDPRDRGCSLTGYFAEVIVHGLTMLATVDGGCGGALVNDEGDAEAFAAALPLRYDRDEAKFLVGDVRLVHEDVIDLMHEGAVVRARVVISGENIGPSHARLHVATARAIFFRDSRLVDIKLEPSEDHQILVRVTTSSVG